MNDDSGEMADVRAEIVARLRQLPEVLGLTVGEIAEICGVSPQTWSNYISESYTEVSIRPLAALEIEKACGIPMGWIYGGLLDGVANPQMRAKLAAANRKADAWLASRRQNQRRGGSASIALLMAVGATLFFGCTEAGHAWKRIDGLAVDNSKVEVARLICKGEANNANLTAGQSAAINPEVFGYSEQMRTVYTGCMAAHGYVSARP